MATWRRASTLTGSDSMYDELCACEEPGTFKCGIRGILAGLPDENGYRYIERCDTCQRFESDLAACLEYARLQGGRCRRDPESKVIWTPE